ncbi:MAG TPA: M56 family metallopeptidase [Syntrophomonas sp.]|nr:M56 family metallopeptidase [Syntrophomonas sp.]
MQDVFLAVLDMSIVASIVILAVLLARLLLKKVPKRFSYILWAVVLFRLLCPFSFESPFSLIPEQAQSIPQQTALDEEVSPMSAAGAAYHAVGDALNGGLGTVTVYLEDTVEDGYTETTEAYHSQVWLLFFAYLWPVGIAVMLIYSAVSLVRLRRKLIGAVRLRENIYLADHVATPFLIGVIRPKIYLPSTLPEEEQSYIILHEQTHIRRLDHIFKMLAFLALSVHWFNPLVWVAFVCAVKDMEMSCDERVLKEMGGEIKGAYGASLLSLAAGRRIIGGSPLAFGEGNIKGRIKNVMNFKKPAFWILAAAVAVVIVAGVGLLTNPTPTDTSVASAKYTGPFMGYVEDVTADTFDVYTDEGGTYIMSLPWSLFDDFPASDRTDPNWQPGWMNVDVYCGTIDNFTWAVVCTGPSMGSGNANVCTSTDGGVTWWVGDKSAMHPGTVTGAGFASSEVGFMSYRYYSIPSPEISRTLDGGKTWELMTVDIPDYLKEYTFTPLSPTFTGESGRYPIELYSDAKFTSIVYLMTEDGGMTWQWEERTDDLDFPYDTFGFDLSPKESATYSEKLSFTADSTEFKYQLTWERPGIYVEVGLVAQDGTEYLDTVRGGSAVGTIKNIPAGTYQAIVRNSESNLDGNKDYLGDNESRWNISGAVAFGYVQKWQPQPVIEDQDKYFAAVQAAGESVKPKEIVVDDFGSNEQTALAWMDAWFDMYKALPKDNMAYITQGEVDSLEIIKVSKEGLPKAFVFSVTFSVRPTYPISSNAFWMAGNTGNSPGRDETWGQMYREVELRLEDDGRYHFAEMGTGGVGRSDEFEPYVSTSAAERAQAVLDSVVSGGTVAMTLTAADGVGVGRYEVPLEYGNGRNRVSGFDRSFDWSYIKSAPFFSPGSVSSLKVESPDGAAAIQCWQGSNLVLCTLGSESFRFSAGVLGSDAVFDGTIFTYLRTWYDEAEISGLRGDIVIPDKGQSYQEIAQAWTDAYEGAMLRATAGSKYACTYVKTAASVKEDSMDSWYPEKALKTEHFYFDYSTVFVRENGQSNWLMAGNTVDYKGNDAPAGALEYFHMGPMYLTKQGWRCDGVGTGP